MDLPALILMVVLLPGVLFVFGCLAQTAVGARPQAKLAVPSAGFALAACAFMSHVTGLPPPFTYGLVTVAVLAVGSRRLVSGKLTIPFGEMLMYSCFTASCLVFLGVHRFVSFGGDWIEHGFTVPMSLMAGTTVETIRPCILGLIYSDFYTVCSPSCSHYYVVQVLAACLNANILFMFLSMLGGERRRAVLVACILFCPFVVYEVVYTWPKFYAVSIAYAAMELLYSGDGTWRKTVAGLIGSAFGVLVHPIAVFVLVSVPFFMPGGIKLSRKFAIRLGMCVVLAVVLPPVLMRVVGIEVVSTVAYYPFSDDWKQALDAANSGEPLASYAKAYLARVGVTGMVMSTAVSFVSLFVPVGGIGRFAFWQNLIFALGPAAFVLGIVHFVPSASGRRKAQISKVLLAFAPVVVGLVFSRGLMILQVAGGHWLVVVLAAFACRQLADIDAELRAKILAFSAAWNWLFIARCVFSIHAKAPEWASGLTANLDSLGVRLPGFSHETPVYFADLFDYRLTMGFYFLGGIVAAVYALRAGRLQDAESEAV